MARSWTLSARSVLRTKIALHRASGGSFRDISQAAGCDHRTVRQCLKRWKDTGFAGLEKEHPGRGRKSWAIAVKGQEVFQKTTQEQPAKFDAVHLMPLEPSLYGETTGVSESVVGRIWRLNDLKPHRTVGFKVSNDPLIEEKLVDIAVLYLAPGACHRFERG